MGNAASSEQPSFLHGVNPRLPFQGKTKVPPFLESKAVRQVANALIRDRRESKSDAEDAIWSADGPRWNVLGKWRHQRHRTDSPLLRLWQKTSKRSSENAIWPVYGGRILAHQLCCGGQRPIESFNGTTNPVHRLFSWASVDGSTSWRPPR